VTTCFSGAFAGSDLLAVGAGFFVTSGNPISDLAASGVETGSGVSLRDRRGRRDCPVALEVFFLPDFFSFIPKRSLRENALHPF